MKVDIHITFSILSENQDNDTRTTVQFSSYDVNMALLSHSLRTQCYHTTSLLLPLGKSSRVLLLFDSNNRHDFR